ncbi:Hypothetical_protein [Hexamita inflata]|uniref:Hypothetical_protein n=1 Tax=Hexamita inflata TaxID=28002 RepID=A0AA86TSI0_9EUKA|nr:Hypothetical protein HINF_LOCUS12797 [Hexamita inflata]
MKQIQLDIKIIALFETSICVSYSLLLFYLKTFNLQTQLQTYAQFSIKCQLLIISTAVIVKTTCQESDLMRTFNLSSYLVFYVQSQFLIVYLKQNIPREFRVLLMYPQKLVILIYLYRTIKYILLLSKLHVEYLVKYTSK